MDAESLPNEVLAHIFSHLHYQDLAKLALVCASWRIVSEDDSLWSSLVEAPHRKISSGAEVRRNPKQVWGERVTTEANWLKGSCKPTVLNLAGAVTCSLIDEPRSRLVLGTIATTLDAFDLPLSCAPQRLEPSHSDAVMALKVSPDGRLIASASNDQTVRVWDADTLKPLHTLTNHTNSARVLAFRPSSSSTEQANHNNILISGGKDHTVRVWDADKGEQLHVFTAPGCGPTHAISATETVAAVASTDGAVRLWCLETGKLLQTLSRHTSWATCAVLRGDVLVSGSLDKKVIDWDLRTGQPTHVFDGHSSTVNAVLLHDEDQIISCSNDCTVRVWSRRQGACLQSLPHDGSVNCIEVKRYASRPDVSLVSACANGTMMLWNMNESPFTVQYRARAEGNSILSLAMSGRYLVATSWDNKALVYDFAEGQESIREVKEEGGRKQEKRPYVAPWQRRQQQQQGQEDIAYPDLVEDDIA